MYYLPVLLVSGVVTGAGIGIVSRGDDPASGAGVSKRNKRA